MKRMLSLLVVLAMVFAMVPTTYAANTDIDFDDLIGATKVITDITTIEVSLKNGSQGTSYSWTPEEDGQVTFQISASEGVVAVVTMTQGENTATSADGTVSMNVTAGTAVIINVKEASSAAADIVLSGMQETPLGGKNNPIIIYPEWVWNEEQTEATATLADVPAGTTYYATYGIGGMLLSVDGGEGVLMEGNPRTPAVFSVTNDTEAAKEVALKIAYPVGSQMNPEVLEELGWADVALAEGDNDGYFYTYTAPGDGTVTVFIGSITEGVTGDIVVTNMSTYAQKTLLADGVDNNGLELTVEVAEGDELIIQVLAVPGADWSIPAAEITWVGNFAYPVGSELNPIYPEFVWNEENTEATATVTAPVGTTYYAVYGAGMMLTINGGEPVELVAKGMGRVPAIFTITNDGEAAAEYSLKIAYPLGSQMNPEVLEELGWVDVALEEGDFDGYYYTYTAPGDGTVTVFIGSITEGVDGDIVVTNLSTSVQKQLLADGVDNNGLELTVEVAEGDELIIQVMAAPGADWSIPAAEITWVGSFAYPVGSEMNPIYPEFVWNEENTEATATVTAPVGTTYYAVYGAGMMLTINDGEPVELVAKGMGRVPAIFTITNDGEAAAEYSLKIAYPLGSQMNPEVLEELEWAYTDLTLEEGDFDGYYYTYTAPADGTVTVYFSSITEGVDGDIVVTNLSTSIQKNLLADGVDNYGLELTVEVTEGDELIIQVMATPDASWNIPAAEITWVGNFTYPEGTEQNPIVPDWEMNDEWTEGSATVKVPAGETLYFTGMEGMLLSINGGEPTLMETTETTSSMIVLTNDGETEAEYLLEVWYPVGTRENPEVLEELNGSVKLDEGDYVGYFYSYTAKEDGTINLKLDSVTEGVNADISLFNNTTYEMATLSADGVNGQVAIEASAGDVITINVVAQPDDDWNYPAADVSFSGEITKGIPGDMDGNGQVNDADALYLLRHTLFADRYPITQNGDVDGNGQINDADALYLLRHTLFADRYPLYPKAD